MIAAPRRSAASGFALDVPVDEHLHVRAHAPGLVDHPEADPGIGGVERGEHVGQARLRSPATATVTSAAPPV